MLTVWNNFTNTMSLSSSDSTMIPVPSSGQFVTSVIDPHPQTAAVTTPIFGNSPQQAAMVANSNRSCNSGTSSNGIERFLITGNGLPEQMTPKQEVHEQPNGQFQITENGALNLMKAESMDILVVNNLAQDLSVGREQSITIEKDDDLPDTSLITGPLDDIYSNQQQEQLAHHREPMELPVTSCLSADIVSMAISESLPGGFLSLAQGQGSNFPCIDNLSGTIFTVPEVEVLTSNVSGLGDFPPSPQKGPASNQSLQELPTVACLTEMAAGHEETVTMNTDSTGLVNTFSEINAATEYKQSLVKSENLYCEWKGCGYSFTTGEELINHVNVTHVKCERDEEYKCHWLNCPRKGKGFNARYKMLIHIRTHTNEKPHVCNVCGKSFSRLENLKIHTRTHSGEKPYICPVPNCNKAYANSSDRFKHVRTHQEQKPFACKMPGCGKRYTDPSSLRKHIKNNGHRVDGAIVPKNIKISAVNGGNIGTNTTAVPGRPAEEYTTMSTNVQSTVVTLIPNDENSTQLASVNGSVLHVSSLISNPLLSSAAVSAPQSNLVMGPQTDSGNSNSSSISTDNTANSNRESDIIMKEDIGVTAKETFCASDGQCLVVTTENGKSQDTPLDLSTCTALQSGSVEENRHVHVKPQDVKLASLGCVLVTDTK